MPRLLAPLVALAGLVLALCACAGVHGSQGPAPVSGGGSCDATAGVCPLTR